MDEYEVIYEKQIQCKDVDLSKIVFSPVNHWQTRCTKQKIGIGEGIGREVSPRLVGET